MSKTCPLCRKPWPAAQFLEHNALSGEWEAALTAMRFIRSCENISERTKRLADDAIEGILQYIPAEDDPVRGFIASGNERDLLTNVVRATLERMYKAMFSAKKEGVKLRDILQRMTVPSAEEVDGGRMIAFVADTIVSSGIPNYSIKNHRLFGIKLIEFAGYHIYGHDRLPHPVHRVRLDLTTGTASGGLLQEILQEGDVQEFNRLQSVLVDIINYKTLHSPDTDHRFRVAPAYPSFATDLSAMMSTEFRTNRIEAVLTMATAADAVFRDVLFTADNLHTMLTS